MKKQRFLAILIIPVLFLAIAGTASALETIYPNVPGLPPITNDSDLSDYVGYFFGLAVYVAGILAVISFAVGAIQLIMSASSPETATQGKDRMKGAVLGLVLTLSAFIILRTINPQFVTPILTPLPGVAGVFYAKGDDLKPAPLSENDLSASEAVQSGYNQIYFKCNEGEEAMAPTLLIWKFPNPGLENNNDLSSVAVVEKNCGQRETISASGSFKMAFQTPGIYYFMGEGCSGYRSEPNITTQEISEIFTAKIKSVKIINNPANNEYYGVIFHSTPDASIGSECTSPMIFFEGGRDCLNVAEFYYSSSVPGEYFRAYSAEIFKLGLDPSSSSGDGVWLYSNVNGWNSGNKSGWAEIKAEQIGGFFWQPADSKYFKFSYKGVNTTLGNICNAVDDINIFSCRNPRADLTNCCWCAHPNDWNSATRSENEETGCGGSIRFGGNGYLVTLYTIYKDENKNLRQYCQSFKKDTQNLSTQGSFLPSGNVSLTNINIIPIH